MTGAPDDAEDPPADPEAVARQIALGQLTAGPRTRAQLAQVFRRRGVPEASAQAVLDRFTEVGLIDDAAFAQAWVSSRQSGRGLAPRALAQELRTRGVAEPLIAEALARVEAGEVEAAARALAGRRAGATRGLPYPTRVRRLTAMLARKGYDGGLALRVVRDILDGEPVGEHAAKDAGVDVDEAVAVLIEEPTDASA